MVQFNTHRSRRLSWGTVILLLGLSSLMSYQTGTNRYFVKIFPLEGDTLSPDKELLRLQEENHALQEKLAFLTNQYTYQTEAKKTFDTPMVQPNAAVVGDTLLPKIQACHIFPTQQPHSYRYLIALSKQGSPDETVQGVVSITVLGKVDEQWVAIPVKYLNTQYEEGFAFTLQGLKELTGELALPAAFIPQKIHLKITSDQQEVVAERTFNWVVDLSEERRQARGQFDF